MPSFEIVRSRKGNCTILIPFNASEPEEYAAQEFRKYVFEISGVSLPIQREGHEGFSREKEIIFLVGATKQATSVGIEYKQRWPEDDGFVLQEHGSYLYLRGANPRGTLFGVYRLLEMLGCTFLSPNFSYYERLGGCESIPSSGSLTIGDAEFGIYRPAFRWRPKDIGEGRSHNLKDLIALIDWMSKVGHNILRFPSHQGSEHGSNPSRTSWDRWRSEITPYLRKHGILLQVGQHGYENFLPADKYFSAHPEWFGLQNNERTPPEKSVFCTSNSSAVQQFVSNIMAYIQEHSELDIFDLWPPDLMPWCVCPNCSALGSESDRHAMLVNKVHDVMKSSCPNVRLECLAYAQYTSPPKEARISEDVLLEFCPIRREYHHSIDDLTSIVNYESYWKNLLEWFDRWSGEIGVYTYYFKYRFRGLPMIMPNLIAQELLSYRKIGVRGISSYSEPAVWIAYEISHRVLACLSWQPDIDIEREIQKAALFRVGPDLAEELIRVFELLEGGLRPLYSARYGFHHLGSPNRLDLSKSAMQEYFGRLMEARRILDDLSAKIAEPKKKAWTKQLRRSVNYAIADMEVQFAWEGDKTSLESARERYRISLQGSDEDFDGIIHRGGELLGRKELAKHYDSEIALNQYW